MPDVMDLAWLFQTVWGLFGIEFTIYGFVFSFRQVFAYGFVLTFVLWGLAIYLDL